MSYDYITKYDSPNYDKGNNPRYIVIHHWGSDGQAFDAVVSWLCNSRAGTSAHYVVEAGKVACIVNEGNTAWHAGNYWYNSHSIGIECRPECSSADVDTLVELITDIYKHVGKILPVIGHKDIVATACPGRYYNKLDSIKKRAETLYRTGKSYKVGWNKNEKGWWWVYSNGTYPKSKWEKIENKWYHFDSHGYMETGWIKTGGKWYFLEGSGAMKIGWVDYKDKWYYLDEKNGNMISDEFRFIKGEWYRFNEKGEMLEKTTLIVGEDGAIK